MWIELNVAILLLFAIASTDVRGVWIPRWSLNDQNRIFTHLDNEFNHIFLQVFALGEAYYPSRIAPSKMKDDAWLRDFLDYAHSRNIKVSAWINAYYSWGFAPFPHNEQHPIKKHSNWYLVDRLGRSILDYSVDEIERLGLEGYYLSPAHPGVQAYLIAIAYEIMGKYPFDGIHLDYIRYPNGSFIYDDALRSQFMRKYYVDPVTALSIEDAERRYGTWGCDDIQKKWRVSISEDLTAFIKRFSETLRQKFPSVIISAAVKPNYQNAKDEFYQDWVTWVNHGYLDFVCLMSYTKYLKNYFAKTKKVVNEPHHVIFGLGIYILNPQTIREQVQLLESQPFGGFVYFSYDKLKENPAYLEILEGQ